MIDCRLTFWRIFRQIRRERQPNLGKKSAEILNSIHLLIRGVPWNSDSVQFERIWMDWANFPSNSKNLCTLLKLANIYKETEEDIFLEVALEQLCRAWNMLQKWPFSCSKFFWYSQARAVWSWHLTIVAIRMKGWSKKVSANKGARGESKADSEEQVRDMSDQNTRDEGYIADTQASCATKVRSITIGANRM